MPARTSETCRRSSSASVVRARARTTPAAPAAPPALELRGVGLVRDGRHLLADVDWTVEPDQRWVVLGRNGSGKSSLVRIASMYLHPSEGTVAVLGQALGRTDVRTLRNTTAESAVGAKGFSVPSTAARITS